MRRKSEQLRASKALLATSAWLAHKDIEQKNQTPTSDVWHSADTLAASITGLRSAVGLLTHHDSQTGTMGPGCGNGDASQKQRSILQSLWGSSDVTSTPNYAMHPTDALSKASALLMETNSEVDAASCPYLPMGEFGNAGAIDADYEYRLEQGWHTLAPSVSKAAYSLLHSSGQNVDRADSKSRNQNSSSAQRINANDTNSTSMLEMDAAKLSEAILTSGMGRISIFNPLGWTLKKWISVKVPDGQYKVSHINENVEQDRPVLFDVMPTGALECASSHKKICNRAERWRTVPTQYDGKYTQVELYIRVEVPALGMENFLLERTSDESAVYTISAYGGAENDTEKINTTATDIASGGVSISNHFYKLIFRKSTGLLHGILDNRERSFMSVSQNLREYESYSAFENYTSANGWSLGYTGARSGSYLMHPSTARPTTISHAYRIPKIFVVSSQSG